MQGRYIGSDLSMERLTLPAEAHLEKHKPDQYMKLKNAITQALRQAPPGCAYKIVGVTTETRRIAHMAAAALKWSHDSAGAGTDRVIYLRPPATSAATSIAKAEASTASFGPSAKRRKMVRLRAPAAVGNFSQGVDGVDGVDGVQPRSIGATLEVPAQQAYDTASIFKNSFVLLQEVVKANWKHNQLHVEDHCALEAIICALTAVRSAAAGFNKAIRDSTPAMQTTLRSLRQCPRQQISKACAETVRALAQQKKALGSEW